MATLHQAATDALAPSFLHELRAFLNTGFDGDFSGDDWDHSTGGVHVWSVESGLLVCHASLVERTLVCSGIMLRVGFVEAVATAAECRRQGHGTAVMARIGELIRERFPLGALSTATHAFYATLGWERWRGPTFVEAPGGRRRTPDDDGDIMILRTARSPQLDLDGEIVCDWRAGDVW